MIIQNNIWRFFNLFLTALRYASDNGHIETVKILLEQEGIDINSKDVYLFLSIFIVIILYFKTIFGDYSNYYGRHLCKKKKKIIMKLQNYFICKRLKSKATSKITRIKTQRASTSNTTQITSVMCQTNNSNDNINFECSHVQPAIPQRYTTLNY